MSWYGNRRASLFGRVKWKLIYGIIDSRGDFYPAGCIESAPYLTAFVHSSFRTIASGGARLPSRLQYPNFARPSARHKLDECSHSRRF